MVGGSALSNPRSYQTGKHLEAFVLLLISREALHGAALLSRLKALLPPEWTVDDGYLYRLLRTLEAEKALVSRWVAEPGGAPVRVYQLTEPGRERLQAWKDDIELRVRSLQTFLDLWTEPTTNLGK